MSDGNGSNPRRDLSVSLAKANVYGLLFGLVPMVLIARLYVWIWGYEGVRDGLALLAEPGSLLSIYSVALVVLVASAVIHELIHGLAWAYFSGRPLRSVRFGFHLKTLTPYAHSKEPMRAGAYRLGAAMPGLLLGAVPSLIGLVSGSGWVTLFGLLLTMAAGGDLLVLWLIRKVRSSELVEDHPSRAGCYAITEATRNS